MLSGPVTVKQNQVFGGKCKVRFERYFKTSEILATIAFMAGV